MVLGCPHEVCLLCVGYVCLCFVLYVRCVLYVCFAWTVCVLPASYARTVFALPVCRARAVFGYVYPALLLCETIMCALCVLWLGCACAVCRLLVCEPCVVVGGGGYWWALCVLCVCALV